MKSFKSGYNASDDNMDYDSMYNLFYIRTHPEEEAASTNKSSLLSKKSSKMVLATGKVSNIAIYDIGQDTTRYLFETDNDRRIYQFMFETQYDMEAQRMVFNAQYSTLLNQHPLTTRPISDRLFIITNSAKEKQNQFWVANRDGSNLRCIHTYARNIRVRIDVKNKKILFIEIGTNTVDVKAFDW